MFFRQAEPSGVWWRHQLEGGRKMGSISLWENGRSKRVSTVNQVMSHDQGERSGDSVWVVEWTCWMPRLWASVGNRAAAARTCLNFKDFTYFFYFSASFFLISSPAQLFSTCCNVYYMIHLRRNTNDCVVYKTMSNCCCISLKRLHTNAWYGSPGKSKQKRGKKAILIWCHITLLMVIVPSGIFKMSFLY